MICIVCSLRESDDPDADEHLHWLAAENEGVQPGGHGGRRGHGQLRDDQAAFSYPNEQHHVFTDWVRGSGFGTLKVQVNSEGGFGLCPFLGKGSGFCPFLVKGSGFCPF